MFDIGDNEHQLRIGSLRCPLNCFVDVNAYDPTLGLRSVHQTTSTRAANFKYGAFDLSRQQMPNPFLDVWCQHRRGATDGSRCE
jgi:hypothetical protein